MMSCGRSTLLAVGHKVAAATFSTTTSRNGIISGKKVADNILAEVKADAEKLRNLGCVPCLAPILLGDDPASNVYIRKKIEAARQSGIKCDLQRLPADASFADVMKLLADLNRNHDVHGIIVQLPLPSHLDEQIVCNSVNPAKDVDGFTAQNLGYLVQAVEAKITTTSYVPCTPLAVKYILQYAFDGKDMKGKKAVVLGRSLNVGLPIALILHADGRKGGFDMTTTICHRETEDIKEHIKEADVVVTAVGIPDLVTPEMIKSGAIIVDVGLNRIKDEATGKTRLCGDVARAVQDMEGVRVTPVPGGVGPCTVACLLQNTVLSAKRSMLRTSV
jgi:methylenetetrahydrofolate dehydrogenase(NAD+)/5,10-methenyltetrahydrofolate cyclohydrolase